MGSSLAGLLGGSMIWLWLPEAAGLGDPRGRLMCNRGQRKADIMMIIYLVRK